MSKKTRLAIPVAVVLAIVVIGVFFVLFPREEEKTYRVGILSGISFLEKTVDGFKGEMAELGYVEGENIVYDVQKTEFDMVAYKGVVEKFVADKVDLIFVFPTEASMEAKAAVQGTDIPVVFSIANIEGTGLVENVRRPGGNITGVRYPGPDIALKRFEIMRELMPEAKRIWIPFQRGYPIVDSQLGVLRPAAESAGITLIEGPADDAEELRSVLDVRAESDDIGIDAILFVAEPLAVNPDAFAVMAEFAYEHKIPLGGALMTAGEFGSVFGVHIIDIDAGRQAAPLADKVLKGTPAGTLPVTSAESHFQLNYKAAQEFGLTVPEILLNAADQIIH